MKKSLLLTVGVGMFFTGIAQNRVLSTKPSLTSFYPVIKTLAKDQVSGTNFSSKHKHSNAKTSSVGTILGTTMYDLQSNASVGRRIINYGDGTISAVWTIASDGGTAYATRGTGYNYFNGSTWLASVTDRIETVRTGFGQIGRLDNGKEVILAHLADPFGFRMSTNAAKGSTTWTELNVNATPGLPPSSQKTLWGRIAVVDSTIHMISNYQDTMQILNGVKEPMVYSRSQNRGVSWNIAGVTLPGYDNSRLLVGSAENYTIDAKGNNVSIVMADFAGDVALYKSSNKGTSFTRTLVDSFPWAPDYTTNAPLDSITATNDGSVSVLIDNAGKTHVAFARSKVVHTATQNGFFPQTIDLIYWNDINKTQVSVPIYIKDIDANGDSLYSYGVQTTNADGTKGAAARIGNTSLLTMPSIGMDANNNIFITFSLPADADSTGDGQSFRDIWVVASKDMGVTWTKAMNLTRTVGVEETFPTLAKLVDGNLHILYQQDDEPGTALQNADADGTNYIKYLKVSASDVLNETVSVRSITSDNGFKVFENYPNPFSNETTIPVALNTYGKLTLTVTNVLGEKVLTKVNENAVNGINYLTVSKANLKSGVYFYTVTFGNESVTKRMIVE